MSTPSKPKLEISAAAVALNVLAALIILVWSIVLYQKMNPPQGAIHDFAQEWTSAKNFFDGYPVYQSMEQSIERYIGKPGVLAVQLNAHPPTSVLLVLPFASLDYPQAFFVWNLLSLVCLAISFALLFKYTRPTLSGSAILPLIALLMTSNSLLQQVNQGQLNLLLLLMFVSAWLLIRNGHMHSAAGILGAATAIKLFPGFLFLYFLAKRQWKAIGVGAASFLLISLVTLGVLGWDAMKTYATVVVPHLSVFREYWPNTSLAGLWSKLFAGESGHVTPMFVAKPLATGLSLLSALLVTGFVARAIMASRTRDDDDRVFGLCVVGMLLASPITWDHYFLLLLLPLAIHWKLDATTRTRRVVLLGFFILLLTINPKWIFDATIAGHGELAYLAGLEASIATPAQSLTVLSYQLYGLIALFIVSFRWCGKLVTNASPSSTLHPASPA